MGKIMEVSDSPKIIKSTNVFNKINGINQSGVGLQNIQPIRETQNRININVNSNINNAINEDGDHKSMIIDLEQNKHQPGKNIHIHISKKKILTSYI